MKQNYKKIAVIGGGIMGTVLVRALTRTDSAKYIVVCEKNITHHKKLQKISSCVKVADDPSDCASADIIFLAVKPQDFGNVKLKISKQTLICSIMAGVSISNIRNQLKTDKVVRMMPNIAARVGESFTVWTATAKVTTLEKKWVESFLVKIGAQLYVKTEQKIDKATAVTGSGPAYIFNTLSVFIYTAQQLGFNSEEARQMIRQVLRGTSALADENVDFSELTRQVTSKGGTTEVALQVFTNSDFKKIWIKAVTAAYNRARKLSK